MKVSKKRSINKMIKSIYTLLSIHKPNLQSNFSSLIEALLRRYGRLDDSSYRIKRYQLAPKLFHNLSLKPILASPSQSGKSSLIGPLIFYSIIVLKRRVLLIDFKQLDPKRNATQDEDSLVRSYSNRPNLQAPL